MVTSGVPQHHGSCGVRFVEAKGSHILKTNKHTAIDRNQIVLLLLLMDDKNFQMYIDKLEKRNLELLRGACPDESQLVFINSSSTKTNIASILYIIYPNYMHY